MIDPNLVSDNLVALDSNHWVSRETGSVSYPPDGSLRCSEIQDDSFWYAHRNRVILAAVGHLPPPGFLLDVGGGTGVVAVGLKDCGIPVGVLNPDRFGIEKSAERGIELLIEARFEDVAFHPGSIPAIGLFDVLEHIEDDRGFLRSCVDSLRDEGRLYLTVPAGPRLWSQHDRDVGHFRRYGAGSLTELMRATGLEVEYVTHFFSALLLPVLLTRTLPHRLGFSRARTVKAMRRDHRRTTSVSGRMLAKLLAREVSVVDDLRAIRMGTSILAVGRKC